MTALHIPTLAERRNGLWLGLLGVVAFSGTLPATRLAVAHLDPVFVGLGRALVAALLAAIVLALSRTAWPPRSLWPRFAVVAAGVVVGWPVLSAFAMQQVPAAHGAVVSGLLPLATALAGALIAHERPSRRFWACALLGSLVVVVFALWQGGGAPQLADLLLVAAVIAAAVAYAEGARLSRLLGGWQVICWVLVMSAPFLLLRCGGHSMRAFSPHRGPRGRASRMSRWSRCSLASLPGTGAWRSAALPPWARRNCCNRSSRSSSRHGCCTNRSTPQRSSLPAW
jgi:drug/metabolite transporter (DMT)-like permease